MSQASSIKAMQGEAKTEIGKLEKFFKKLKKFISTEFLVVLVVFVVAIPVSYLFYLILKHWLGQDMLNEFSSLTDDIPVYLWCYAISVAGCYLSRLVLGAVQSLTKKPAQ